MDPIEEKGGLNLYGFVGNDGVNQVDFLGMKECDLVVVITLDASARKLDDRLNGGVMRAIEKQIEFLQKMVDRCIAHKKCCCDSVKIVPKYKDGSISDPDVSLNPNREKALQELLENTMRESNGDFPVLETGQMIGQSVMAKRSGISSQRANNRNPLGYTPQTGGIIATPGDPAVIAHELGHYLGYWNPQKPMIRDGKTDPHHTSEPGNIMGYDFDPNIPDKSAPDAQWCKLVCDKAKAK